MDLSAQIASLHAAVQALPQASQAQVADLRALAGRLQGRLTRWLDHTEDDTPTAGSMAILHQATQDLCRLTSVCKTLSGLEQDALRRQVKALLATLPPDGENEEEDEQTRSERQALTQLLAALADKPLAKSASPRLHPGPAKRDEDDFDEDEEEEWTKYKYPDPPRAQKPF